MKLKIEGFFVDEADIDLNSRIGFGWQRRGRQIAIPTPGTHRKHALAGALQARSGRVVRVGGARKNPALFLALLRALRQTYRRARRLLLMVDNYIIHRSRLAQQWLSANRKFTPGNHPWVNTIERI